MWRMLDRAGRHRALSCSVGLLLFVSACGGSSEKPAPPAPAAAPSPPAQSPTPDTNGAKPPAEAAKPPAARATAPPALATPVDFETLKTLLPALDGWNRAITTGEMIALPTPHTNAYARYTKDTSTIHLEIGDSALSPVLLAPASMFTAPGFEERTDSGYRKAVTIRGFPACEEWNKNVKTADLTVIVANRFVVHAKGREMTSLDPVRAVVQAINFQVLAKLK
jgi:hypothetical protein